MFETGGPARHEGGYIKIKAGSKAGATADRIPGVVRRVAVGPGVPSGRESADSADGLRFDCEKYLDKARPLDG